MVILEGKKTNGSGIVVGYPQFLIIADLVAASIDSVQSLDICTIYSENTAAVPRPYIVTAVIQWPVYNAWRRALPKIETALFYIHKFMFYALFHITAGVENID